MPRAAATIDNRRAPRNPDDHTDDEAYDPDRLKAQQEEMRRGKRREKRRKKQDDRHPAEPAEHASEEGTILPATTTATPTPPLQANEYQDAPNEYASAIDLALATDFSSIPRSPPRPIGAAQRPRDPRTPLPAAQAHPAEQQRGLTEPEQRQLGRNKQGRGDGGAI